MIQQISADVTALEATDKTFSCIGFLKNTFLSFLTKFFFKKISNVDNKLLTDIISIFMKMLRPSLSGALRSKRPWYIFFFSCLKKKCRFFKEMNLEEFNHTIWHFCNSHVKDDDATLSKTQ